MCGAHVKDKLSGEEYDIYAKCVINATGPFTDVIRSMENPSVKKICQPSSGVHIVLPDYYRCVKNTFKLYSDKMLSFCEPLWFSKAF